MRRRLFDTPVLVVDALGLSNEMKSTDGAGLLRIVEALDRQYYEFRAKVPHRAMLVHRWGIWGTKDFATIRLNDMFVVYSPRPVKNQALRFLITSTLLYQSLLLTQVIPRGGLGYGSLVKSKDLVLGAGFVDAYETSEKRADGFRDICTRLLIELLGQLEFADRKVLRCLDRPGELEAATARLQRLLHASKASGPSLSGGIPDIAVINAMEFVRAAEMAKPGMQKSYDFLCDAAHPNYTKHGYLLFAGSEYDNWRNPVFAAAAREILDRTAGAAEQAIAGIVEAAIRIVEDSLPQILVERRTEA